MAAAGQKKDGGHTRGALEPAGHTYPAPQRSSDALEVEVPGGHETPAPHSAAAVALPAQAYPPGHATQLPVEFAQRLELREGL